MNKIFTKDASASMAKEGLALSPALLKEAGSKGTSYAEMSVCLRYKVEYSNRRRYGGI